MQRLEWLTALGLLVALLFLALPASSDSARLWRRAELRRGVGDAAVRVLAVESGARTGDLGTAPPAQRVAVGSQDGVTFWRPAAALASSGETRRFSQGSWVQDLHFSADGSLWVATAAGLWRLDSDGRLQDRSPGTGEDARFIHRVASLSGVVFASTQSGAYATRDGLRWQRLNGDLPMGPAGALAVRGARGIAGDVAIEMWLVVRGVLWRAELMFGKHSERALASERWVFGETERLPAPAGLGPGATPLQILLDLPDADVALLFERAIATRSAPDVAWQVIRPVLPPEAKAKWLAFAAGDYWLATDRGLMRASQLRGPWHRAGVPLGSAQVFRVAPAGEQVLAATAQGLFVGTPQSFASPDSLVMGGDAPGPSSELRVASDPPVLAVQQAALRYLGLSPAHMRGLRRGAGRRAWLPLLSLRVAGAYDRDDASDYDEAFLSGATRTLRDWDRQRGRDLDASLTATWDLGDLVYNPESLDVSREARQVISLRDDVLDQVNQAYYERQALLRVLELAAPDVEQSEAERYKMRLRADELAAGLDGWTGGWFGEQTAAGPS